MSIPRGWSGKSNGWQYLAQRIDPSGAPPTWLGNELPLQNVLITDVLSGPTQMTALIDPVYKSMKGVDGLPIFGEWSTAIYAECDGIIRAGNVVVGVGMAGSKLSLDCSGFVTVAKDMEYPGDTTWDNVDPIDLTRHMWEVIQADPDSDMNLQLDSTTTTNGQVLIGASASSSGPPDPSTSGSAISTTGTTDSKAYQLNWWSTHDMGGEIDKLAQNAPFDYHERHAWLTGQTDIGHYLDFGYPSIGYRRPYLRFVIGENVQVFPEPHENGGDFANHCVVLGAGEGSATVRGESRRRDGRIRRMVTISDPSITDKAHADRTAQLEVARRSQPINLDTIIIRNMPSHAPLGSFGVGDEIRLSGAVPWADVIDMWVRITSMGINPEKPDLVALSVIRSDWVV